MLPAANPAPVIRLPAGQVSVSWAELAAFTLWTLLASEYPAMLELTQIAYGVKVPCPSPLSNPVSVQVVLLIAPFALSGAEVSITMLPPTSV